MEGNPVATPIGHDTLSYKYNSKSLEAVNLIKERINRIIDKRAYVDGSKQKS